MTFRTDLDAGKKTKAVKVFTNAPRAPMVRLEVSADIEPGITCIPRILDFGRLTASSHVTLRAELGGYAIDQVKILDVSCEHPLIKAALVDDGKAVEVTVLPGLSVGRLSERVMLTTDHPEMRVIPGMTVSARVEGDLKVKPELMDFPKLEGGRRDTRMVEIVTEGKQVFQITKVESNHPAIETRLELRRPGRIYALFITATDNFRNARLTIHTNLPEQPTLQVVLFGKGDK